MGESKENDDIIKFLHGRYLFKYIYFVNLSVYFKQIVQKP